MLKDTFAPVKTYSCSIFIVTPEGPRLNANSEREKAKANGGRRESREKSYFLKNNFLNLKNIFFKTRTKFKCFNRSNIAMNLVILANLCVKT